MVRKRKKTANKKKNGKKDVKKLTVQQTIAYKEMGSEDRIKRDCEAESGCIFRRRYFCTLISDRGSIFGKLQRFHTRGRLCDRDHNISGNG